MTITNNTNNLLSIIAHSDTSSSSSSSHSTSGTSLDYSSIGSFKNVPHSVISHSISFCTDSETAFMSLVNRGLHLLVLQEQHLSTLKELGLPQESSQVEIALQVQHLSNLGGKLITSMKNWDAAGIKREELDQLVKAPRFLTLPMGIKAKQINAWIRASEFSFFHAVDETPLPCKVLLPSLRRLEGNFYGCRALPTGLAESLFLESIHIAFNNMPLEISDEICRLPNLKILEIDRSGALPNSLGMCTALKKLSIANIDSPSIPEQIQKLTQLEDLSIGNALNSIPDWIQNLTQLKTLYLGGTILSVSTDTLSFMSRIENCGWDRTGYEIHQIVGEIPHFQKDLINVIVDFLHKPHIVGVLRFKDEMSNKFSKKT